MMSPTKQLLFATIAGIAVPVYAATDAITQLSFVTEPRVSPVGEISEVLTIQTQNTVGGEEKLDETGHLTFVSSSATGEFLGSTGKPVTTTMSKGTANRSFYYRDMTSGTQTITVTLTTGSPERSWQATQTITVGSGTSGNTATTSSSTGSSSSSSIGGSSSSHSAPSASVEERLFKAEAGRERSVLVHTPVRFEATKESPYGVYRWSFGDGGAGSGNRVTHWYAEPGTYVVVLNADFNGRQETSRTTVEVSVPQIMLRLGTRRGTVVLSNMSSNELNLGGWSLRSGQQKLTIPEDTILLPSAHITLALSTSSDELPVVDVCYPDGELIARYDAAQLARVVADAYTQLSLRAAVVSPYVALPVEKVILSTATPPQSLVLPVRRSWWQSFIDTVFAN